MFLEAHFGEVELHMPDEDPEEEEPKPKKDDDDGEEKDAEDGEDEEDTARREEPALLVSLDEAFAQISLLSLVSCGGLFEFIFPRLPFLPVELRPEEADLGLHPLFLSCLSFSGRPYHSSTD